MQVGTLTIGGNAVQTANTAFQIAQGSTAQRPAPVGGMIRFNTDSNRFEHATGSVPTWANVGLGDGTVSNVTVASDSTGIVVSNATVTGSGTIRLNLAGELAGLNALAANGFVTRTAAGTYAAQTLSFSGDAAGTASLSGATTLTLANSGVVPGSYGGAAATLVVTIDAKGRITNATAYATSIPSSAVSDATPANTPSTIVKRDAAGSFVANGIQATNFYGPLTGNASSATKLATARTIALSGDATGSVSFDGSANATISTTLASTAVVPGTYGSSSAAVVATVDAKGRVTAMTAQAITIGSVAITDATPLTIANTVVKRDANGGFNANNVNFGLTEVGMLTVRAQGVSGGRILLNKGSANSTVAGAGVIIDQSEDYVRIYESGSPFRGLIVDLRECGMQSQIWHGGNLPATSLPKFFSAGFASQNVSNGLVDFPHMLNCAAPIVMIYDNTGEVIMPDRIVRTSVNVTTIDISSFGTITGTWRFSAMGTPTG